MWQRNYDRDSFAGPLYDWSNKHEANLRTVSRQDVKSRLAEEEEFDNFLEALELVDSSNSPLNHLTPEPTRKKIYKLTQGKWVAYYWVDTDSKKYVGLLVIREDVPPIVVNVRLMEAQKRI